MTVWWLLCTSFSFGLSQIRPVWGLCRKMKMKNQKMTDYKITIAGKCWTKGSGKWRTWAHQRLQETTWHFWTKVTSMSYAEVTLNRVQLSTSTPECGDFQIVFLSDISSLVALLFFFAFPILVHYWTPPLCLPTRIATLRDKYFNSLVLIDSYFVCVHFAVTVLLRK